MSISDSENQKYETIGKTICSIRYWMFAIRIIVIVSVIALLVLYLLKKPLWIAPIIGVLVFMIYRSIRRVIIRALLNIGRDSNDK